MKSVDELVQDFSDKTQSTDIPNLDSVSGLDFESVKRAVVEGNVPQEHLRFVYDATSNYGEETAEAVVGLQFHYEVVHQLRVQLQKQFADAYLGDREAVILEKSYGSLRIPPTLFTRWHFETFNHPHSQPGRANDSHLGYRYLESPVDHVIGDLPTDVSNEHRILLDDISTLQTLETIYGNTILQPVIKGIRTDIPSMKMYFDNQQQKYLSR